MAIAEINPVAFATSELGSMEDAITSITNNSMEPISLPSGTGLFTEEQVREILIKFLHSLETDDLDGLQMMYAHGLRDKAQALEDVMVNEFMESGDK